MTYFEQCATEAENRGDISTARRIRIEGKIATKLVETLIAAGFKITVNDGDENVCVKSTDVNAIVNSMFTTDEEYLFAYNDTHNNGVTVYLVYGNDGYDVISDYSLKLSKFIEPVNKYIDDLESGRI